MELLNKMFKRSPQYNHSFNDIAELTNLINDLHINCKMYINPIKSLKKENNRYTIDDEEEEYHFIILINFENRSEVKMLIDEYIKNYDVLVDEEFEPNVYYLIIGDIEMRISLIIDLPNSLNYIKDDQDILLYELNVDKYVLLDENNVSLEKRLIPYKTKMREFELMKKYGIFE